MKMNENFDELVNDHDYSIKNQSFPMKLKRRKKEQTLRFLEFNVLSAAVRNASKSSSSSL
jgi:hypothetical protein